MAAKIPSPKYFTDALERREEELLTRGMAMAADLVKCEGDRAVISLEIQKRMNETVERFG